MKEIKVSCYSGYQGDELPRYFDIKNKRIKIVNVISRWITPDSRFFKITGDDGDICTLRLEADQWYLEK